MKLQIIFRVFLAFLITVFSFSPLQPLQADTRKGNLDLFLLLDRSISMEQEFSSLQKYVEEQIFETILQNGDSITMIAFYRDTQDLVSGVVGRDLEIRDLSSELSSLCPNMHYTDIGSALDYLKQRIDVISRAGYPSYVLLLTDGIHEGPPDSPYPGKTDTFTHPLLTMQKQILQDGWKVCLLPITVEDRADELAEEVVSSWQTRN